MRAVLKQQMEDKEIERREDFLSGVADSEQAVQYDHQCLIEDAERDRTKRQFLTAYRDTNKQVSFNDQCVCFSDKFLCRSNIA